MITTPDRLGLLLALPGFLLASAIAVYLVFAKAVCDPLYQRNELLNIESSAKTNPSVAKKLGRPISPPPREGLVFHQKPYLPTFCHSPR